MTEVLLFDERRSAHKQPMIPSTCRLAGVQRNASRMREAAFERFLNKANAHSQRRCAMAKVEPRRASDVVLLLDGENLTAERLDVASIEMLQTFSNIGLRCCAEQCRHWQMMPRSSWRGGNWKGGNNSSAMHNTCNRNACDSLRRFTGEAGGWGSPLKIEGRWRGGEARCTRRSVQATPLSCRPV